MKRLLITLSAILLLVSPGLGADSLSVGARIGTTLGQDGHYTEAFGDLYLNRLISIGASIGYSAVEKDNRHIFVRDESVPVTALFKAHAPTPIIKPYGGLGQTLIFHDKRGTKGSPVAIAGVNLPLGPFFLNLEYKRQFDDRLNFLAGGAGVRF